MAGDSSSGRYIVTNDTKISFVVLTYNRPDALLKVLQSLARQCKQHHEVIVADDGSSSDCTDYWARQLPSFACRVKHVWHPDQGFTASRARNLGAMVSTGSYLVFLDGDCVPSRHFVQAHEALAAPGCFVNGNRVLLSPLLTGLVTDGRVDLNSASWYQWMVWRLKGDVNKLAQLVYWPIAPGRMQREFRWKKIRSCNFAVWKTDFESVNGFDETFAGWGHEDADLVLRLHHAGLVRCNGYLGTEVYHLWHRQFSRDSESRNYGRVLERMKSDLINATVGLAQNNGCADFVVTTLN